MMAIEPHMIEPAQDLGFFDAELIRLDAETNANPALEVQDNQRRFGLSRLWVLGAYELVRTIERRFRPLPGQTTPPIHQRASALKREFERLRIPLAKFEAARRHLDDWPIAYPAMNATTGGIAWQVVEGIYIGRRDLADKLLAFLEDPGAMATA